MFSVRFVSPVSSQFTQVAAVDMVDAVNHFIELNLNHCLFVKSDNGSATGNEGAYFAIVDVDGEGKFVGRHFYAGIGRKGGVNIRNKMERASLGEVEQELNLPDGYLSEAGWEGEETVEDARNRLI